MNILNKSVSCFILLFCLLLGHVAQAREALFIVDMQEYFARRSGNYSMRENQKNVESLVGNILELIVRARNTNTPIFIFEYLDRGPTLEKIRVALDGYSLARYITKTSDGAFDLANKNRSELINELNFFSVDRIIISGANGGACVEATIYGAMAKNLNLEVVAVAPAIADFRTNPFSYPYRYYRKFARYPLFSEVHTLPEFEVQHSSQATSVTQNPAVTCSRNFE